MKRETCSACGASDLEQFLDLGLSPIADAYTATADEASVSYPLQVAVCGKCRLVQLLEVVDHETLFGTGYSFYSSASAPLSAYHTDYARSVLARHGNLAAKGVVEVGCNDGDLLRHFAGWQPLGVDPASGPAAAAQDRGLEVMVRPFGLAVAHDIRDRRGPQGLVFANHVLAHVADVADVLAGIKTLLAPDGIGMVEVQYLPDLLVNNAFDLVYHEHRNFFSLSALEHAAGRWDLHVIDAELTDRQGGSLRVTLSRRPASNPRVDAIRASEGWLDNFGAYEGMQGRAERIHNRLLDLLAATPGTIAGYGAPAKATTLLNFCGITRTDLEFVVDTTPAKQGRYIPGTGIPIVPPLECKEGLTPLLFGRQMPVKPPSAYLLLAHNYAAQIMKNEGLFKTLGGHWIVPIPAPVIL